MDKDRFKSAAADWVRLHTRVSISAVGAHTKNGPIVFSASIKIGSAESVPTLRQLDSPAFWAKTEVKDLSADGLQQIVDLVLNEKIPFMGATASLLKGQDERPSTHFDSTHSNRHFKGPADPRAIKYSVRSGYFHAFVSSALGIADTAWHLRSLDTPYSDMDELFELFGVPNISNEALIELIVASPVSFDPITAIRGDIAKIQVNLASKANPNDVKIGYIGKGESIGELRDVLSRNEIDWTRGARGFVGNAEKVTSDSPYLDLFLSYKGVTAHCIRIHNRERHTFESRALYSAFDAEFDALSELLFTCKKSHKSAFEDAVSLLFHMLGFSVAHYGGISSLSEVLPDVIAMTGSRRIAVIECTLGLPDQGDQVAKVLQRTQIIRRAISRQGWDDFRVSAVVVTNLPEAELATHREDAEANGVSVICREDLERLIERLFEKANPDYIMEQITQRVSNPIFRRIERS